MKSIRLERHDQEQGWIAADSPVQGNFADIQKADRVVESPRGRVALFDRTLSIPLIGGGQCRYQQEAVSLRLRLLPQALNQPPPDPLPSPFCMNGHPRDFNRRGILGLHRQKADDATIQGSYPSLACPHRLSAGRSACFIAKVTRQRKNNPVTGGGIPDREWAYFKMRAVSDRHSSLHPIGMLCSV